MHLIFWLNHVADESAECVVGSACLIPPRVFVSAGRTEWALGLDVGLTLF